MDYQEREFHNLIRKKADEIESSGLPEGEKNNLYHLIDEILQPYIKMQRRSLRNKSLIAGLNKTQIQIYRALEEIISTAKVNLSNLGEIAKEQRENKNILLPPDSPFYLFSKN